jgi:hypothetical protein
MNETLLRMMNAGSLANDSLNDSLGTDDEQRVTAELITYPPLYFREN